MRTQRHVAYMYLVFVQDVRVELGVVALIALLRLGLRGVL